MFKLANIFHVIVFVMSTDKNEDEDAQVSSRPSAPSTLFDFLNMKMSLSDSEYF